MTSYPKEKEIIDTIRVFTKTFRYLSPTNIQSEKGKFIKSKTYNPVFDYPQIPADVSKNFLKILKNIKFDKGGGEKEILEGKLKETKLKLKLLLSVGNPRKITTISEKLYGCKFNKRYIKKAKKHAEIDIETNQQSTPDAKQTAKLIRNYLSNYQINDWRVQVTSKKDFYIQIRYKKHLVSISKQVSWQFTTLDSLLAHEIDGHVIRAVNALKQSKEIFRNTFPFYIKTEEGLASYLGDYCAQGGELSRKHHAIKYLGGFIALNNSFRQVYEFFRDNGFESGLAFQRAMRLKRGFTDTSQPGCFAREAMYYEGMLNVKKYIDKGGGLEKLYAGKVGLNDLNKIPMPKGQIIPKRILPQK